MMQAHPPIWQISLYLLQAAFCVWLLWVGISFSRPNLRFIDLAIYSVPLIYTGLTSSFGWWLCATGQNSLSSALAIGSFLLLLIFLFIVLGVGI